MENFNIEEEPSQFAEDQEADELLKIRSTIIRYKHELKWYLDEAVPNWREPREDNRRIMEQNKAFGLLETLINENNEPVSRISWMTIIILSKKRINQEFELNPFILKSIIRAMETFYPDDLTTIHTANGI
jgi:hypothetical protein